MSRDLMSGNLMSRDRWLFLTLIVAGVLALTSGGLAFARQAVGQLDGDWELIAGQDEGRPFPVENTGISLLVRGDSVSGFAGCGDYDLRLSGDAARLKIAAPAGAAPRGREQCAPQLEEVRSRYLDALASASRAVLDGGMLRLAGAHTRLVFRAMPLFPVAQLDGTSWVLETFGETWSGQQIRPQVGASTLRFLGEHRFAARLACGRIVGLYRVARTVATTVSYDVLGPGAGSDRSFCPRAGAIQDGRVSEILRGFRASVQGDRLILTRDRLQIVYRAAPEPAEG
jgi:hypothetical protein